MSLLAVASVAPAQQTRQQRDSQTGQQETGQQRDSRQQQQNQRSSFQRDEQQNQRAELPESLKQLDLNEQQKQDVLGIYRESDRKAQELWSRVQNLHRQAISMEAAVIAAARLEGHDHSAHITQSAQQSTSGQQQSTESASNTSYSRTENEGSEEAVAASDDAAAETRSTLKPNTDNNESDQQNRDQNQSASRSDDQRNQQAGDQSDRSQNKQASSWKGLEGDLNIVALRVGVAQPDGRVREYFLVQPTSQNEDPATCQVCQGHQNELMQVWDGIHKAHEQLVELEADTIVKVEASLTEEQLKQLDSKMNKPAEGQPNQTRTDSQTQDSNSGR